MSDAINLNFINNSNDNNNSQIVIFQKNQNPSFDEVVVAWKIIQHCSKGDHHPFLFPLELKANITDNYGNDTPLIRVDKGALYSAEMSPSGMSLVPRSSGTSMDEIQIRNDLRSGLINANIFRDGRLLATKAGISTQQKAAFNFKPSIWIGLVQGVQQGDMMNSAIVQSVDTELSLFGVKSADIVLTDRKPGVYNIFTMQNVVMA